MQEVILVIRRSITSREKKAGGTNAFDSLSGEIGEQLLGETWLVKWLI